MILTTKFGPTPGGIERYLEGLATGLAERGDRVVVMAHGVRPPEGGVRAHGHGAGYELQYVDGVQGMFGGRPRDAPPGMRTLASAVLALRRYIRGRRTVASLPGHGSEPHRVYVGVWNEVAHGWCASLRRRSVPYRLFAYGREVVRPMDPVRARWRAVDFRSAEVVYACSAATARLVEEAFEGVEAHAVRPGIEEPDGRSEIATAAASLRRNLGISPAERVLVSVGRLVRRKGVHRVLAALASTPLEGAPARYVVVGEGPERDRLNRMSRELGLADRVDFLGRVDDTTKWAVYELGDLFVMSADDEGGTDWEGFGIVYLEAAVMGLPAVAGRSGGAPEAVRDGVTGLLVDPRSSDALVGAIAELLGDLETCRRMGEAARSRAESEFSWDRAVARLLEVT